MKGEAEYVRASCTSARKWRSLAEESIIKILPGNDGSPPVSRFNARARREELGVAVGERKREREREREKSPVHVFPELGEHALRTSGV